MIPGSSATAPLRELLAALAETGRTGVLHVGGSPGGAWYLVEGRITHADSPVCPGVGERLVSSGRISAATWRAAYDAGHRDRRVGRWLVEHGHLVQGELACRVLATICDATHAILHSEDAPMRFVPDERHWLGPVTQIELAALGRETVRRWLGAEQPVLPRRTRQMPPTTDTTDPTPPMIGGDDGLLDRIRTGLRAMR